MKTLATIKEIFDKHASLMSINKRWLLKSPSRPRALFLISLLALLLLALFALFNITKFSHRILQINLLFLTLVLLFCLMYTSKTKILRTVFPDYYQHYSKEIVFKGDGIVFIRYLVFRNALINHNLYNFESINTTIEEISIELLVLEPESFFKQPIVGFLLGILLCYQGRLLAIFHHMHNAILQESYC